MLLLSTMFLSVASVASLAQETETLYLSGTGLGDTKTWQFYCSDGMNSRKWTKIEVPSQWELQGFGEYTFGRFYLNKDAKPSSETGTYKTTFKAPASWSDKQVEIVFEGVMTDTEVLVNGKSAGDIHQGGFYSFSYDISDKIIAGKKNSLEVKVSKESADKSVNAAERRADWWLFGGIYRPVFLQVKPKMNIKRIAVSAEMDGTLKGRIYINNVKSDCKVRLSISPVNPANKEEYAARILPLQGGLEGGFFSTQWQGVKTWDCEHPNLYNLKVELLDANGSVAHVYRERIGFRTIEFRPQDGFYCNGKRMTLKGVNRHCFYPDGGRTTNKALSISDVKLIKQMNMNAIRSHYSPDKHLLDVCDSLGVFYLDEFTGWHGRYDTAVGNKLLEEFIAHDVNHPCIFLWSNGNEGGWNKALDPRFAELDPQQRHVVHAWADFNGVDTHHYPTYQTGPARLANGYKVFMPTEFVHAQYDCGAGAGLEDFWNNYSRNPMFAGGFIWSFSDEAVRRTDKGGILDSDGPNGPDGIVGPYCEREASFYTVRELWSPIKMQPFQVTKHFNGEIFVSNKYLFTNLSECAMKYRLYTAPSPLKSNGSRSFIAEGVVRLPAIEPGETGKARMDVPVNFYDADILEFEAFNANGESICNWSYPIHLAKEYFTSQYATSAFSAKANVSQVDGQTILSAAGVTVAFNDSNATIASVRSGDKAIPLTGGPLPVGMRAKVKNISTKNVNGDAVMVVKYVGALDSIVWRMTPDGLLSMNAVMLNRGNGGKFEGEFFDKKVYNLGLTFSHPESEVSGLRWMGKGPYRVWRNRLPGTNYGVWQKAYNNTITGESFESLVYPEFKGYHANTYWATIESAKAPFTVYSETDGVYLRLFTPQEPVHRRNGINTMPDFPAGDISFLLEIPAIKSFKSIPEHGPLSQPSTIRIKQGDDGLHLNLWFDFRDTK